MLNRKHIESTWKKGNHGKYSECTCAASLMFKSSEIPGKIPLDKEIVQYKGMRIDEKIVYGCVWLSKRYYVC